MAHPPQYGTPSPIWHTLPNMAGRPVVVAQPRGLHGRPPRPAAHGCAILGRECAILGRVCHIRQGVPY
eukprot:2212904-Prymnesium_polylepis.1